jgi:hypothetical protein
MCELQEAAVKGVRAAGDEGVDQSVECTAEQLLYAAGDICVFANGCMAAAAQSIVFYMLFGGTAMSTVLLDIPCSFPGWCLHCFPLPLSHLRVG